MLKKQALTMMPIAILFTLLLTSCRQQNTTNKTIYVAPTTVTCPGTNNQPCLLVADGFLTNWQTHQKEIKGFTYQPGSLYTLLVQETSRGGTANWTLQEITAQEPARIRNIILGPERTACPSETGQMCYLYKTEVQGNWQFYYSDIGGLNFEPGYAYNLTILERTLTNPSADSSSNSWTVMQVTNKQPMSILDVTPPAAEPTIPTSSPTPSGLVFQEVQISTLGMRTVLPQGWQPLNHALASNQAWGDNQASFVNFNAIPGSDARTTLAQMVGTGTQNESTSGQVGDVQIGGRNWSVYSRNNGAFSLNAAVTIENGTAYIISLYAETGQYEEILRAMLENFAITQP